jgi:hypothetical protein
MTPEEKLNIYYADKTNIVSDTIILAKFIYRDPCTGEESPICLLEDCLLSVSEKNIEEQSARPLDEKKEEQTV